MNGNPTWRLRAAVSLFVCLLLVPAAADAGRSRDNRPEGLPCVNDDQCGAGEVCGPLAEPRGNSGRGECQPGCRIGGDFVTPGQFDAFPNNCQSCQPGVSTTGWTPASAGLTCRLSAGVCDPAEVCTGSSGTCPVDARFGAETTCRPSAGDCDAPEVCDGKSESCGADLKRGAETTCRPSAGECDAPEVCDGTNDVCGADLKRGAETTCRPSAGVCDAAEVCDGQGDVCGDDLKRGAETTCRPSVGICDAADVCDGSNDVCGADLKRGAETTCRPSAGDCDTADVCDGTSDVCGADLKVAAGTACRAANGDCDAADTCDGSSDACVDAKLAAGTECRAANGDCDVAESCDGSTNGCPADGFRSAGATCRSAVGSCDLPEQCTGDSRDCPSDVFRPAGFVCRPIAGECDQQAEVCTGTGALCPLDVIIGPAVCRPSAGPCDVAEECSFLDSYPDCPPDRLASAGTVCRPPVGPVERIRACDVPEVCDGQVAECPEQVRAEVGEPCSCASCDPAGSGECVEISLPGGATFTACQIIGEGAIGTACTANGDCASTNCREGLDGIRQCMPEGKAGFGDPCDGDDFFLAGDPDGIQCSGTGGAMVCCTGASGAGEISGNLATDGQSGTCRGCCRTNDLTQGTMEDLVGCNVDSPYGDTCCSGRCARLDFDEDNCDACGNSCYETAASNSCLVSVVQCNVPTYGGCVYETACPPGDVCTSAETYRDTICPIFGIPPEECSAETRCTSLTVPSQGTLCQECDDDSDCSSGQTCRSGCDGSANVGVLFCTASNYCVVEPGDCISD